MPGYRRLQSREHVQVAAWEFLKGEMLSVDGQGGGADAVIPNNATIVIISAETGAIYYSINHAVAGVNSGGYLAAGGVITIGPLSNLNSIAFMGAAAASIHIQYFMET